MFIDSEREEGREKETSSGCLSYALWLGIEPTTLWCMGQCSNQLSHLAKVEEVPSSKIGPKYENRKIQRTFPLLIWNMHYDSAVSYTWGTVGPSSEVSSYK